MHDVTVGELATVQNLGPRLLLEILITIDYLVVHEFRDGSSARPAASAAMKPSRAVGRAAARVTRARWAATVRAGDPRLAEAIARVEPMADTAAEAARLAAERSVSPGEARRLVRALSDLERQASKLKSMGVLDEVRTLVAAVMPAPSAQQMVLDRLGVSNEKALTLQEAATRAGLSRERVRQVENQFREVVAANPPWTPSLDRAIRALHAHAPDSLSNAWAEMIDRRIVDEKCNPQTLITLARVLGRPTGFTIDTDHDVVLAGAVDSRLLTRTRTLARMLVTHWGATTVDEVVVRLDDEGIAAEQQVVRLLVTRLDGFSWLDEPAGWFWITSTPRNRLLNQVEKIMSVAGSLPIAELRAGVGRHHRMKGFRPPREVLASLCVQTGLYRRDDERIIGDCALPDWKDVLGENEATLVEVLFAEGPVMRRDDLERRAVDEHGLNRSSFYVYLSYSPVLARYAPSVYGLRGAEITAAEVDVLIPPRVRTQVLQDHGWTGDGDVWIAYRISAASGRSGVLGTPGTLKNLLRGSFQLTSEDNRPVGTLVVEENMWGLSPFFRRFGIEEGDYVVLEISLSERRAKIYVGTDDLLLRFQKGE